VPIGIPRWYDFLEPARAAIACTGEVHHLAWRRGKLVLEDHELAGERALLALGGELPPCLQALALWANQFGMAPEHFEQMASWLGDRAALAPPELAGPRDVAMVLNWERAWRASRYLDRQGRFVERAVRERALPALRDHVSSAKEAFGCRLVRGLVVRALPGERSPTIEGRMDRVAATATASLTAAWVAEVWARGAAVVDGAFVLELVGEEARWEDGVRTVVRAVRWEPDPRSPTAALPVVHRARISPATGGGWQLAWEEGPIPG